MKVSVFIYRFLYKTGSCNVMLDEEIEGCI